MVFSKALPAGVVVIALAGTHEHKGHKAATDDQTGAGSKGKRQGAVKAGFDLGILVKPDVLSTPYGGREHGSKNDYQ